MNIGNITSNNFNLDVTGKDIQIEVYEQLIGQLQQENKQLKSNWNMLKECLKDVMNSCDADDKDFVETILDIMKEIEQRSDKEW